MTTTDFRKSKIDNFTSSMSAALNDLTSVPGAGTGSPNVSQAAVGYFVDQKKGEVNELKMVIV